jgi:ankyrin repeat protein
MTSANPIIVSDDNDEIEIMNATFELKAGVDECSVEQVKSAIRKGANVNTFSAYHRISLLQTAVSKRCLPIVKLLVKAGAKCGINNSTCPEQSAPLHLAIFLGENEIAKCIIKYGKDVDYGNQHIPNAFMPIDPIHLAISMKNAELVQFMLKRPDCREKLGLGNFEVAYFVLQSAFFYEIPAAPFLSFWPEDWLAGREGTDLTLDSPLSLLIALLDDYLSFPVSHEYILRTIDVLIEAGISPTHWGRANNIFNPIVILTKIPNINVRPFVDKLLDVGVNMFVVDDDGKNAISLAFEFNNFELATYLSERNPAYYNPNFGTPAISFSFFSNKRS